MPNDKSRRINITDIGIDPVDNAGAAQKIASMVNDRAGLRAKDGYSAAYVCTPNAEIMMDAQKDAQLKQILIEADLVIPDGAGVVLAARLLGYGKITRTPGYDVIINLLSNPDVYPFSFYFLGGKPGVAEAAAENINKNNPGTKIAGMRDGYFNEDAVNSVIKRINESGADILLVALGSPKQEKWIYANRHAINAAVCIGVGGTIDGIAGLVKRAPPFFRNHGMEWLYRLAREPWRIKRMMKLPKFIFGTVWARLFGEKTPHA